MPGKYSHSVVLADYSNRGLIALPPDQYDSYLQTAPRLSKSPAPGSHRLRGTKSAQAIYRPPSRTLEGWDALRAGQPHPSLSTNTTPVRARVNVSADDEERNVQPVRISRYFDQLPRSTPAVHEVSKSEPKTAYERQQSRNGPTHPTALPPKSRDMQSKSLSRSENLKTSSRKTKSSSPQSHNLPNVDGGINQTKRSGSSQPLHKDPNSADRSETFAASSTIKPKFVASKPTAQHEINEGTITHAAIGPSARKIPTQATLPVALNSPRPAEKSIHVSAELRSKPATYQFKQHIADIVKTDATDWSVPAESHIAHDSRTREPSSCTSTYKPSYVGSSKHENEPVSQFAGLVQASLHSRESSGNSTVPIQRPETKDGSSTKTATIASPRSSSLREDRNTPSRTTGTSTVTSSRRQQSTSSISTTSPPDGHYQTASSKKQDLAKISGRVSAPTHEWSLPEIREDHGFSPSIFEDNEGGKDKFILEDFDIGLSIGHVSSGKDVSYDNDTASELSAALPPPISRFKDEEDEFNANMVKLFGGGIENVITKKSSHTFGRRPSDSKKSKGFFSKFRSKS